MKNDRRAIHMLRPAPEGAIVRETLCFLTSNGGGIGTMVLDFACGHRRFLGTDHGSVVTCKKCLKHMSARSHQEHVS